MFYSFIAATPLFLILFFLLLSFHSDTLSSFYRSLSLGMLFVMVVLGPAAKWIVARAFPNEPWVARPPHEGCEKIPSVADLGMPSIHAATMMYFSVRLAYHLAPRAALGWWFLAAVVMAERVASACHTVEQVVVGAMLGGVLAMAQEKWKNSGKRVRHAVAAAEGLNAASEMAVVGIL